jgi:Flp pilus assembly protein TadB
MEEWRNQVKRSLRVADAIVVAGSSVFASEVSPEAKTWLVLGAVALTAAFYVWADWSAKRSFGRRVRALMRERPELAEDLEAVLRRRRVRRSLREWYRDEREFQKALPPARMTADRRALPILLAVVTILVAALLVQAVFDSPVAGWVALAGLPVVMVCGFWALAPISDRSRDRERSP